jgi:hypothetical protein
MQKTSARVRAFFDQYESSLAGSDATAPAAQYGESFIFAGPQATQAVRREDLVKVLPKRQEFFRSLGLRSSRVVGLEEASVGERCVLVKAQWRMQLASDSASVSELDVFATYLLQEQPDGLRIVFQLDHDDLSKRVQQLALAR